MRDAETDQVLKDFPDILERIERLNSGADTAVSLEELAARLGVELPAPQVPPKWPPLATRIKT